VGKGHTVTKRSALVSACVCVAAGIWSDRLASAQPPLTVYQTTLEEPGQLTREISTETLLSILATHSEPVFDVRTAHEYAIAHIPGTINIYEKEVDQIAALYPERSTPMVLYCNGPACGKSKRTSEQLVAMGYTNVRRYQLGMPVWRALSQTVQTDMPGVDYIYRGDRTAVFVDARTPAEFGTGTVPGAVNVQQGEATAANDDGRLPFTMGGFLVRGGDRVVLVDAGLGEGEMMGIKAGALLESLAALGVAPDDVTDLVFTHLHIDHIGWASADGRIVFPNATYRCAPNEWEHFMVDHRGDEAAVLEPATERFEHWTPGDTIAPGLDTLATPGHTPGSTTLVLSSGTERVMFLGDVVHCPVQLEDDEWAALFDVDPDLARRTRTALAKEVI